MELALTQLVSSFRAPSASAGRRPRKRNDFRKRMFNVFRAGSSPAAMGSELAKQFAGFEGTGRTPRPPVKQGMQQDEAKFIASW